MNIVELNSPNIFQVRNMINDFDVVALLGSGISIWQPTNLPTGAGFGKGLYRALFYENGGCVCEKEKLLQEYYNELPFEIVNETCPNQQKIRGIIHDLYNNYSPNPIHRLFAELIDSQKIKSIFTTNFDCCLDQAISEMTHDPISKKMGAIQRIIFPKDITEDDIIDLHLYF